MLKSFLRYCNIQSYYYIYSVIIRKKTHTQKKHLFTQHYCSISPCIIFLNPYNYTNNSITAIYISISDYHYFNFQFFKKQIN
eukprot:UN04352